MVKKLLVLMCASMVSVQLLASTLKNDSAIFQALTGISTAQSEELVTQARGCVAQLYQMGLSEKEIDKMISDQLGAVARIGADAKRSAYARETDMYAGYVKTSTMLKLLALAAVISGAVGVGIGVGLCAQELTHSVR
ncbi:hypothetical protein JST56_02640 [Candidatus Dependentiae bacterium]|jgi:hypothetical protein|nr:hypothetical protein [Candidatus Dependentiae bacterium]